jgi:hypothetical protein
MPAQTPESYEAVYLKVVQLKQENELLRLERDHYRSCARELSLLLDDDTGVCIVWDYDPKRRGWSINPVLTHPGENA